jgi:alkaline phosphatase D
VQRRSFIKRAGGGVLGSALAGSTRLQGAQQPPGWTQPTLPELEPVDALPPNLTRAWIGPGYWANRLQDWRLAGGRIECLRGAAGFEVRSVSLLTREIVAGMHPCALGVRATLLADGGGGGFCGFLIGAGGGALDYRAAALVQRASGTGGGLLCTYGSDGQVRFREHTNEERPLAFAEMFADQAVASPRTPAIGEEILLRLEIVPSGDAFNLVLSAWTADNQLLAAARRKADDDAIAGGMAIVSSPRTGVAGARYAFRDVRTGGAKIATRPERALGPIAGALHSLNGRVLKVSAQLMPIGDSEPQRAKIQFRSGTGAWTDGPSAQVEAGYTAHFRVENWDAATERDYRIVYPADGAEPATYAGRIRREPARTAPLTIGLVSCTIAAARSLEGGAGGAQLPAAEPLGRYTHKNLYVPHRELAANLTAQRPDLLVFAGDQFYENSPTRNEPDDPAPELDYLYKWLLWVWSFRELTRDTPAILLVDDHDVYHGNLWGNGGRAAPERDQNRGGYKNKAAWVSMVQRTQCGHNPDPFDPTPVEQGIGVYYGAFRYGGASFAIVEDRKFKTAPIQGADLDVHVAELLGERQERFLEAWAKEPDPLPRICISQTLFGCLQTSPDGRPLLDFDANGYPKPGRDRAITLLRNAKAIAIAGDQHLASVVRHGVDTFKDGVIQFAGPAGGTSWQRWFEPAAPLPNRESHPRSGDFIDAFGNKMHVMAVANPRITFAEYRQHVKGRGQGLGDRRLKAEGYAIVRVDPKARHFVFECWPWDGDVKGGSAKQFEGWPITVRFDEV